MAKGSDLIKGGRVNVYRLPSGKSGIRVDGVTVAFLTGEKGVGYRWEEHPAIGARLRVDATDAVLRILIERKEIDPNAPVRDLRAEATISADMKRVVIGRDKGLCQYCLIQGRETPGEAFDHFVPAGEGGKGTVDNVQLACAPCNRKKWHHLPRDFFGPEWVL